MSYVIYVSSVCAFFYLSWFMHKKYKGNKKYIIHIPPLSNYRNAFKEKTKDSLCYIQNFEGKVEIDYRNKKAKVLLFANNYYLYDLSEEKLVDSGKELNKKIKSKTICLIGKKYICIKPIMRTNIYGYELFWEVYTTNNGIAPENSILKKI